MEGFVVRLMILWSIGGYDMLLDTAHDLDSIVESNGQHNRKSNGSHT